MVIIDKTSSGHKKATCEHCNETLVRQPHYNNFDWELALNAFIHQHNSCITPVSTSDRAKNRAAR